MFSCYCAALRCFCCRYFSFPQYLRWEDVSVTVRCALCVRGIHSNFVMLAEPVYPLMEFLILNRRQRRNDSCTTTTTMESTLSILYGLTADFGEISGARFPHEILNNPFGFSPAFYTPLTFTHTHTHVSRTREHISTRTLINLKSCSFPSASSLWLFFFALFGWVAQCLCCTDPSFAGEKNLFRHGAFVPHVCLVESGRVCRHRRSPIIIIITVAEAGVGAAKTHRLLCKSQKRNDESDRL